MTSLYYIMSMATSVLRKKHWKINFVPITQWKGSCSKLPRFIGLIYDHIFSIEEQIYFPSIKATSRVERNNWLHWDLDELYFENEILFFEIITTCETSLKHFMESFNFNLRLSKRVEVRTPKGECQKCKNEMAEIC